MACLSLLPDQKIIAKHQPLNYLVVDNSGRGWEEQDDGRDRAGVVDTSRGFGKETVLDYNEGVLVLLFAHGQTQTSQSWKKILNILVKAFSIFSFFGPKPVP